jgi:hypothetical protein
VLPAGVVYAVKSEPGSGGFIAYLVLMLLIPALPSIVGALLGAVVTVAPRARKKSNLMSILGQMTLVIAIISSHAREHVALRSQPDCKHAGAISTMIASVYPPAKWFRAR